MTRKIDARKIIDSLPTRSDDLAELRHAFDLLPAISCHLTRPESARLVIDANAVISEVRWMVKKRKSPAARTALQEAIASKTIVAFAPSYLEDEMQAKLALVAEREELSHPALVAAWQEYRAEIKFYPAAKPVAALHTSHGVDPKDAPYIETYTAIGAAAILTNDPHLAKMGAHTVRFELTVAMRTYARETSVELTIKWQGMLLLSISGAIIAAIGEAIQTMIGIVTRAPRPIQILLGIAVLIALLHPPTRERLLAGLERGRDAFLAIAKEALPLFADLALEAKEARTRADSAWAQLQPALSTRRIPLGTHVLAICLSSPVPVTSQQLVEELRRLGVKVQAKTFPRYLRRVLRAQEAIQEIKPQVWALRTHAD